MLILVIEIIDVLLKKNVLIHIILIILFIKCLKKNELRHLNSK